MDQTQTQQPNTPSSPSNNQLTNLHGQLNQNKSNTINILQILIATIEVTFLVWYEKFGGRVLKYWFDNFSWKFFFITFFFSGLIIFFLHYLSTKNKVIGNIFNAIIYFVFPILILLLIFIAYIFSDWIHY
jgi:magnesium-transporting ATPase (P-type)